MKFKLALLFTLSLAGANAMACYTVYDRANQVVYNAQAAPVDMSRSIHETLPAVFPGGHMVFAVGTDCPREAPLPRMTRASGGQVLLTDRRTAEAMHLPHTILPSGAAMVSQRPAEMRAGVVVATAPVVAPPAVIAPAVMVAPAVLAAAALPGSTGTVITEMRDPPMTVVQDSGGVIVSELAR